MSNETIEEAEAQAGNPFETTAPAKKAPAKKAAPAKAPAKTADRDVTQKEAESTDDSDEIETVTVEYKGFEVTVPADQDDWPTKAIQFFTKGFGIDGLEALMGPLQWAKFNAKFPRKRDFDALNKQLGEELGFGSVGN